MGDRADMLLDESCESIELWEYEPGLGVEFIIPENKMLGLCNKTNVTLI